MSSEDKEIEKLENEIAKEDIHEKLIEIISEKNSKNISIKVIIYVLLTVLLVMFGISWLFTYADQEQQKIVIDWLSTIFNQKLFLFILVGFGAQMVDGALGMAYGATATSFLLSLGVTPSMSSASIHIAEVFTTGASGLSHLRFGNVNIKLFKTLLFPGMIGSILGAIVISVADHAESENFIKIYIKPIMSFYLMVLGFIVLKKAFKKNPEKAKFYNVTPLALFGGFMDSVGGGGWGPIVTSTLVSRGRAVNYTIGSVNLAEFFVALSSSLTFIILIGVEKGLWQVIVGLIIGGVIAAPFAAYLVKKVKRKPLMIAVGMLIIFLSLRNFIKFIM